MDGRMMVMTDDADSMMTTMVMIDAGDDDDGLDD